MNKHSLDANAQAAIGNALYRRGVSDGCPCCGWYTVSRRPDGAVLGGIVVKDGVVAEAEEGTGIHVGAHLRLLLLDHRFALLGRGILDVMGSITCWGGQHLPAAVLVCGHCGHATHHGLAELGLKISVSNEN